jgi:aldose 1-epimerase
MEIVSEIVGKFTNGDVEFDVSQITLRNTLGVEIKCISYGATMISVVAPDRHGILESIVLCASYDELVSPTSKKPKYVGTIGRVCNRL